MQTIRLIRLALPATLLALASCAQPTPAPAPRVNVTTPPPAQPAQAEPIVAQPAITEQPAAADSTDRWWLLTPDPVEGQLRVVASGRAESLVDARQLAVDNGHDLLASSLGFTPEDATIERTSAERVGEYFTAWVLISAANKP